MIVGVSEKQTLITPNKIMKRTLSIFVAAFIAGSLWMWIVVGKRHGICRVR
jgi:hypothetical protein